jgi:hypothetical protein
MVSTTIKKSATTSTEGSVGCRLQMRQPVQTSGKMLAVQQPRSTSAQNLALFAHSAADSDE